MDPKLLPITFAVRAKSWRMLQPHGDAKDKRYQELHTAITTRDDNTCRFCGFKSNAFQEITHLDEHHGHNDPSNVVTACPLCHLDFHWPLAGMRNMAMVIWCPEFTQAQLNHVVRSIFVSVSGKNEHEETARTLYNALEMRASVVEEYLGKGGSNPIMVARAALYIPDASAESLNDRFFGLRLLPKIGAFSKQIKHWQEDASLYGQWPAARWAELAPKAPVMIGHSVSEEAIENEDEEEEDEAET